MKKTILYAALLLLAAYAGGTTKLFSRSEKNTCLLQTGKGQANPALPADKKSVPAGATYPGIKPLGFITSETY